MQNFLGSTLKTNWIFSVAYDQGKFELYLLVIFWLIKFEQFLAKIRVFEFRWQLIRWLEIIQYYSISNISTYRKSKTVKNLLNLLSKLTKHLQLLQTDTFELVLEFSCFCIYPRPQWIQAQKTGAVINFNRWRDWDGKSLRGLDWYKEEEAQEYEGLSFKNSHRISVTYRQSVTDS